MLGGIPHDSIDLRLAGELGVIKIAGASVKLRSAIVICQAASAVMTYRTSCPLPKISDTSSKSSADVQSPTKDPTEVVSQLSCMRRFWAVQVACAE